RPQADLPSQIQTSLRSGNAHELAAFFDQRLELIIDSERVNYGKISNPQAELILRAFFKKHPPDDFHYVYQGASTAIQYSTGTYRSGGESYLVYILLKRSGDRYGIGTIHFRREAPAKFTARQ
ncbi:MAG: DUF4783 domain-containing protein, partial [Cytophagaceae bacterium]|nr:DUF4783 domain-containing protein [Cytophagaceae bacterium]